MVTKRIFGWTVACGLMIAAGAGASTEAAADPLSLYAQIHAALAADSVEGVAEAGAQMAEQVRAEAERVADPSAHEVLAVAAAKLEGTDLVTLRQQFREVSKAFAGYVNASGTEGAQLYFCPMADAYWMQAATDSVPANPYFGQSMPRCGSKVDQIDS